MTEQMKSAQPFALLSEDQVRQMIGEAITKYLSPFSDLLKSQQPKPKEHLCVDEAIDFLSQNGVFFTKATMYKKSYAEEIPSKRIGKRLVYSRTELFEWIESQTTERVSRATAALNLATSANRKK